MPIVKIDMWEGRSRDKKQELIKNVTSAIASTLEIPSHRVHIVINEVGKDNWGINGEQASRLDS